MRKKEAGQKARGGLGLGGGSVTRANQQGAATFAQNHPPFPSPLLLVVPSSDAIPAGGRHSGRLLAACAPPPNPKCSFLDLYSRDHPSDRHKKRCRPACQRTWTEECRVSSCFHGAPRSILASPWYHLSARPLMRPHPRRSSLVHRQAACLPPSPAMYAHDAQRLSRRPLMRPPHHSLRAHSSLPPQRLALVCIRARSGLNIPIKFGAFRCRQPGHFFLSGLCQALPGRRPPAIPHCGYHPLKSPVGAAGWHGRRSSGALSQAIAELRKHRLPPPPRPSARERHAAGVASGWPSQKIPIGLLPNVAC